MVTLKENSIICEKKVYKNVNKVKALERFMSFR